MKELVSATQAHDALNWLSSSRPYTDSDPRVQILRDYIRQSSTQIDKLQKRLGSLIQAAE